MHLLSLFIIALLHCSLVTAQAFCTASKSICLYSQDNGTDVLLTLRVASTSIKWASIGFGSSMKQAEVYVAHKNQDGKTFTVSRRASTAHREPAVVSNQPQQIIENAKYTVANSDGTWQVSFTRPKAAVAANGVEVDVSQSQQRIIWAQGTSVSGSGTSASLGMHNREGSVSVNLYDSKSQFNPSSDLTPIAGDEEEEGFDKKKMILWHGILMFVAWQVCAPAGVIVARFFKNQLGVWWFRSHILFMFVGTTLLTTIGFVLSYLVVGKDHFNPASYDKGGVHVVLGIILFILMFFQAAGGVIIDRLWSPTRTSVPWWDVMHWWLGRLLYVIGFVNIPLGFYIYEAAMADTIKLGIWIAYFVWAAVVFLSMIGLNVRLGQQHHQVVPSKATEAQA